MSVRLCLDRALESHGAFQSGVCKPECKSNGRVAYLCIPDTPATRAVLAEAKGAVSRMDKKCKCAPCFHLRALLSLFGEEK